MHDLLNLPIIAAAAVLAVIIAAFVLVAFRRRPRKLDLLKFTQRWQEVQKLCSGKTTWPLAVINADKLLDEALKKHRCKGKTMGERLVSAQRRLSDNDGVWFGHKLRNKVVHEDMAKLRQQDVQTALRGFRQALKDLGALK
jgi:hypothetical protein